MNILKLIAELGLDASGFNRGMDNAKTRSAKAGEEIGSAFKSAFVRFLGAAAVVGYVRSITQEIDHLKDSSERLGVTTDEFQRMQIAAKRAGLELEGNKGIGKVFNELAGLRAQAEGGNVDAIKKLDELGLSMLGAADNSETMYSAFLKVINLTDSQLATTFGGKVLLDIKAFREELSKTADTSIYTAEQIQRLKEANIALDEVQRLGRVTLGGGLSDLLKTVEGAKKIDPRSITKLLMAPLGPVALKTFDKVFDFFGVNKTENLTTKAPFPGSAGFIGPIDDRRQRIEAAQAQRKALEDELNKLVLPTRNRSGGFSFSDFIASASGRGVGAAIGATAAIKNVAPPLNPELKAKIDEITRLISKIAQEEQDLITFRR